ncbi:MBL fold metallo-hydrolase [Leptospira semungkisensis]|nr:MBL fold metallo-hydrolase [Leptospira semungkisensis]
MRPKRTTHEMFKNRYVLLLSVIAILGVFSTCESIGHKAEGERLQRVQLSPQWKDGQFVNPQPLVNYTWKAIWTLLNPSPHTNPSEPVPVLAVEKERFSQFPKSGLRVTWLGHSTNLIEIDGTRILTDPVWGDRTSPAGWLGPKRWFPPLIELEHLPEIDAVLISHDHYDHLDHSTISIIKTWNTKFIVPLGVGANLEYWGVPKDKIIEMDWWGSFRLKDLEIVSTPARHASGRYLLDNDEKLWSSYALLGPKHRVYFSGDTGLFPGMKKIGEKYGPFDLTMIETGQYDQAWPDWHIGPEQAVIAHTQLKGKKFLPIHWGLFALASHSWTEPIERVMAKAKELEVIVLTPKPGESTEPDLDQKHSIWWPKLPWKTEKENPIVSGQLDDPKEN